MFKDGGLTVDTQTPTPNLPPPPLPPENTDFLTSWTTNR